MKDFLKSRSKILFAVAILNVVVFLLFIPELLEYSKYVSNLSCLNPEFNKVIPTMIFYVIGGHSFIQFNFLLIIIMMFAALANIAGFIYKKEEFNFIAIGLYLIIGCISAYVFHICGVMLLMLLFILSIIGYVDQYTINKESKKKSKKATK